MKNPWEVESVWAFSYLHCPECSFNTQDEDIFQNHAVLMHPMCFVLYKVQSHKEDGLIANKKLVEDIKETIKCEKEINGTLIGNSAKRAKKYLTLTEKLEVIKMRDRGMKFCEIGKIIGINESSVRTIFKRKDAIVTQANSENEILKNRIIEKMEKRLISWIIVRVKKGCPPEQSIVRKQARSLFHEIKAENETEKEMNWKFSGFYSWFENFKERNKVIFNDILKSEIDFPAINEINELSDECEAIVEDPLSENESAMNDYQSSCNNKESITKALDLDKTQESDQSCDIDKGSLFSKWLIKNIHVI